MKGHSRGSRNVCPALCVSSQLGVDEMKAFPQTWAALIACAGAATIASCAGGSLPSHTGDPGAASPVDRPFSSVGATGSWMKPGAKNEDLLYVGGNNGYVTVYSYPEGKQVGALENPEFYLPAGECVDQTGDVFITDLGANKIFEYRHGGTRAVQTLQSAIGDPNGCAVDPTTGNLAVSSIGRGTDGNVAIYSHAKGSPRTYLDAHIYQYYWCSYDPSGDLYVNGLSHKTGFAVAELPKGGSSFIDISLSHKLEFPSGVQWDGKYLVLGDQVGDSIYQFTISGSGATLAKTVVLDGASYVHQFWIDGRRLIAGDHGTDGPVYFYDYPSGGEPTKTITKGVGGPNGLTISNAVKGR
jgi:hypothetical protein